MPELIEERHVRSRWSLPSFATVVTFAFLVVSSLSPGEEARAFAVAPATQPGQSYVLADPEHPGAFRDAFAVSRIRTAPAVGVPDPGTAQAIAYDMVLARGWDQSEFECLVALWNRESHWNVYAHNPSSGAYGIPQALPGDKMATAGADWQTNPVTQITWGLGYIAGRYGTPCGAWEHSERKGWY
ncbi:lytic transglycosylase domain-containing protein [Pseudolysinimonas yzui]|uniref:aggregation-promoting factor C-terminal-like domain-containing protein n=1 Tax=Pseudolysinimonas yzui TaxID=2708254 RepID=UPI0027E511A8|nr:lytic transglycosylase domain-containing protein [Pseudolysinimonas yzui]